MPTAERQAGPATGVSVNVALTMLQDDADVAPPAMTTIARPIRTDPARVATRGVVR
jgi:hypothetical protein